MPRMPVPIMRQAVSTLHIVTFVTFLYILAPVAVHAAPPAPKIISIAEARSLPLGTVVIVDGSVTVPSGVFSSSTFDQGFAMQDHTGGIYVSVAANLGFAPRQQVRVTGKLADSVLPGLLVLIDVTAIKAHGIGPTVQPRSPAQPSFSRLFPGAPLVPLRPYQLSDPAYGPRPPRLEGPLTHSTAVPGRLWVGNRSDSEHSLSHYGHRIRSDWNGSWTTGC